MYEHEDLSFVGVMQMQYFLWDFQFSRVFSQNCYPFNLNSYLVTSLLMSVILTICQILEGKPLSKKRIPLFVSCFCRIQLGRPSTVKTAGNLVKELSYQNKVGFHILSCG